MSDSGSYSGSGDSCDDGLLSGGLPVYTVVKEGTEAACKKWAGMTDGEAKVTGMIAGTTASILTTLFTGQS